VAQAFPACTCRLKICTQTTGRTSASVRRKCFFAMQRAIARAAERFVVRDKRRWFSIRVGVVVCDCPWLGNGGLVGVTDSCTSTAASPIPRSSGKHVRRFVNFRRAHSRAAVRDRCREILPLCRRHLRHRRRGGYRSERRRQRPEFRQACPRCSIRLIAPSARLRDRLRRLHRHQ